MSEILVDGGAQIVIGTQWGDEGKGKIAGYLGDQQDVDLAAKPNGGHNAGHTDWKNGKKFVTHGFPMGIINPDLDAVVGVSVYSDPVGAYNEISDLFSWGVTDLTPKRVTICPEVNLVMPHDIYLDRRREVGNKNQGSTKRGIAFVASDKYRREGGIDGWTAIDMSVKELQEYAGTRLKETKALYGEAVDIEDVGAVENWASSLQFMKPYFGDGIGKIRDTILRGRQVILEGSQGMWLDIDHGPHGINTSAHTEIGGILNGAGVPADELDHIYACVKAFKSRVGNGPFVTRFGEADEEIYRNLKGEPGKPGYEQGSTTSRDRDLGYLDMPEIREALQRITMRNRRRNVSIALTKLDLLNGMGETIPVATSYTLDGERVFIAPKNSAQLEQCQPNYRTLEGWSEDISGIRKFDDLPEAAINFVEFIEDDLGVPVSLIGVGADRSQIIDRRRELGLQ